MSAATAQPFMTNQQLQIAVAEKMGWKAESGVSHYDGEEMPWTVWRLSGGPIQNPDKVPPYSTSIDAIQKACLERFNGLNEWDFEKQLLKRADAIKLGDRTIWQLTALDWCEAFVATCEELEKH